MHWLWSHTRAMQGEWLQPLCRKPDPEHHTKHPVKKNAYETHPTLPEQLTEAELQADAGRVSPSPPKPHLGHPHTSNMQRPERPKATFDPKPPAPHSLEPPPRLGTRRGVKHRSERTEPALRAGSSAACSAPRGAQGRLRSVKSAAQPQRGADALPYPGSDPPERAVRSNAAAGDSRLQEEVEPQSSTAAHEKALSLLGSDSNPLEEASSYSEARSEGTEEEPATRRAAPAPRRVNFVLPLGRRYHHDTHKTCAWLRVRNRRSCQRHHELGETHVYTRPGAQGGAAHPAWGHTNCSMSPSCLLSGTVLLHHPGAHSA